jgi:hypothetical protein
VDLAYAASNGVDEVARDEVALRAHGDAHGRTPFVM